MKKKLSQIPIFETWMNLISPNSSECFFTGGLKKIFQDKLDDGYYDYELEAEIENLETVGECFRKIAGEERG